MIEKFRDEFERHIEEARTRADRMSVEAGVAAEPHDAAA
jgi:vacuolar-type H+-ATPase subunit H